MAAVALRGLCIAREYDLEQQSEFIYRFSHRHVITERRGCTGGCLPRLSEWRPPNRDPPLSSSVGLIGTKPTPMRLCGEKDKAMSLLKWALIFLVVSIVAAVFGFGGISAASADIAKILFYIFVIIFVVLLVMGFLAARRV